MSHFICKFVPHFIHSLTRHSKFHRVALTTLSENTNHDSFTVNYFIDKCGFSLDKAISASKYVNFDKADKPDACLSFLKKWGFTDTQILKLMKNCPRFVMCDPEKTLFPKIEFLVSKGFRETEIPALVVVEPNILIRSLEGCLVPTFDLLKDYLGTDETAMKAIKRCPMILPRFQARVLPNIELLKEAGVANQYIAFALRNQPFLFACSYDKMKELVEDIKKMGFDPKNYRFIRAVCVMGTLSKLAWKNKLEVYKKWGCSEEEVLSSFKNEPACMKLSEEKIDGVIGFFVNEMGWRPQMVLLKPQLFSFSLQKRIVPRCSVYKVLLSKDLLNVEASLYSVVKYSEDIFLEKFVDCYLEVAPELLSLYKAKMEISNAYSTR